LLAPLVVYGVYLLLVRLRIDDKKIVPLTLGGGIYAVLAAGIAGSGQATGGYFEIEEGSYAFQNATINIGHQIVGLGVTLGIAAISGLVLILLLEKTIGLRVPEADELEGLDEAKWGSGPPHEFEDLGPEIPPAPPAAGASPAPAPSS
jgi:ammonia channel protein AmtB